MYIKLLYIIYLYRDIYLSAYIIIINIEHAEYIVLIFLSTPHSTL